MTKHLRFLIVLLMTLVWSAGWAAESVYKTLSFPDDNKANNKVQVYTSTWTAKIGSDSWSVANFNNNKWNNSWKWIRCGNTTNASKAKIINTTAFDKAITKVIVNASAIKEVGKINSIKLETSKQANFSSIAETVTLEQKSIKQGNLTFELSAPIENGYYRLTFDCQKSSKGNIQVDQIDYYINDSKTSTTLTFPQQSLTYATTDDLTTFTGQAATLTADGTALTGKTITYSKTGDDIFSSFDTTDGTLALNGNAGTATVTATFNGNNDDTYASSSASYTITVNKVYTTLASFKADVSSTTAKTFCLKLTDAIVTYVNGQKAYLQDATSGILVFGTNAFGLNVGEKYTGTVNVSACLYNGMAEITGWNPASDIIKTENVDIPIATVTLEQLNGVDYSKYECVRVKVENAKIATKYSSAKKATITQAEQQYIIYGEVAGLDVNKDDVCDFVGYPMYNKTSSLDEHRLSIWSQDDIVVKYSVVATTLSFDTETTAFNVEKNSEDKFVAPKAVVKDAADNVVAGAKITYKSDNDAVASVGENGNVTFGSAFGTATITASYAGDDTHKPATSIFYTITYSKIPTEMAWSESSVSVNIGELPSLPTLKLTAHGEDIRAGKTIKYSSSDESLVSIDEFSGKMHIDAKAGSTTITATFAGDDTYAAASAEYTLNVIDPNKTDVTFDFTKPESYGYAKPVSNGKTVLSNGDVLVSGRVTITNENSASTTTRFKDDSGNVTFRVYTGAILTVEAPAGFAINKIDFTDNGSQQTVDNFIFSTGELSSKTWTGLAKKLTMEVATGKQVFLKSMIVNLVKVENVTLNESEINTIEAKALANVTLKRSMVENEWNTICLPFNVTAEQAKTAFGEGVMIAQLNKNSSGNKLSFSSVDAIVASTPYLIKPTIAAPADGYKFEGVTINDDGKGNVAPNVVNTNSYLAFVGIYNTVDVTNNVIEVLNNNYYAAFLGANNKIFKANGGTMKGFRAYFAIPNNVAASALCVTVNGTTTSIKSINGAVVESNAPVYNLQGQRVDGNNLTPGIYVKAGKKFVVR